jgi:uncharacterized protein (DUF1501 family)
MKRRQFLTNSILASAGSLLIPNFLKALELQSANVLTNHKKLIIIQLSGGNDGLNTVVPYRNDIYYKLRPDIAIEKTKILTLNDELGLNPVMIGLKNLYDDGMLSVINNVGYPNPDRSHFRSMDIWQTASSANEYLSTGWLGRYLDAQCTQTQCLPHYAIEVDDTLSLAMKGERSKALAVQDAKKLFQATRPAFLKTMQPQINETHTQGHDSISYLYKTLAETVSSAEYLYDTSKIQKTKATYATGEFGRRMKTIAELILSGVQTQIFYVSLSGFDTHIRQNDKQEKLLEEYAISVAALIQDLKANSLLDNVLVMTFSEFGRRVAQNGSNGTDHGTANQVFLMGNKLKKKGFYNAAPDLTDLDEGDLKFTIDFRNIYADVLKNWLEINPNLILGQSFEGLGVV